MGDAIGLVALDVMRARGAVSAPELAEQMGIPVATAEAALDRLPARDDVHVESVVDDRSIDGQVRYRVASPAAVDAQASALSLEGNRQRRGARLRRRAAGRGIAKKEAERK